MFYRQLGFLLLASLILSPAALSCDELADKIDGVLSPEVASKLQSLKPSDRVRVIVALESDRRQALETELKQGSISRKSYTAQIQTAFRTSFGEIEETVGKLQKNGHINNRKELWLANAIVFDTDTSGLLALLGTHPNQIKSVRLDEAKSALPEGPVPIAPPVKEKPSVIHWFVVKHDMAPTEGQKVVKYGDFSILYDSGGKKVELLQATSDVKWPVPTSFQ